MKQTDTLWNALTGGFFASVAYLTGGVDNLLVSLAILMLIDYITGVMVGFQTKTVSSQRAFKGITKKVAMILFVIVANQADILMGSENGELRNYIIYLLIATEGISLTENLGKLGAPIPQNWLNALELIKAKGGITETPKKEEEKNGLE